MISKRARSIFMLWVVYVSSVAGLMWTLDSFSFVPKILNPYFLQGFIESFENMPALFRWDSIWYFAMARDGYWGVDTHSHLTAAFYPLYPALMRLLHEITGMNLMVSGIWISIFFLGAFLYVLDLYLRKVWKLSNKRASTALLIFLLLPGTYLCVTAYHVSLFLFLTVTTLYAIRSHKRALALLAGFFLGLTHMHSVVVAGGLLVEAAAKRKTLPLMAALAVIVATAALMAHHYFYFGNAFYYVEAKASFSSQLQNPLLILTEVRDAIRQFIQSHVMGFLIQIISGILLIASLVLTIVMICKTKFQWALEVSMMLLLCAIQVAVGSAWGFTRFSLLLFPAIAFMMDAKPRPALQTTLLCLSASIQCLQIWHWVSWLPPAP